LLGLWAGSEDTVRSVLDNPASANDVEEASVDDFTTGLVAALAEIGVSVVNIRGRVFYEAVVTAFEMFKELAASANVEPRFALRVNRVYGDSPAVRDALTRAVQRDLISLDNPEYVDMRLKLSRSDAEPYLSKLPGTPDLYRASAAKFLASYPAYS